MLMEPVDKK